MFWLKRHRESAKEGSPKSNVPIVSVTLEQVKKAVIQFERNLPKGINRTILIRSDNEINFLPLVPYLNGIPDKPFYMSREAYEIFPEEEKLIPYWLDIIQKAVDAYMEDRLTPPLVPGDPNKKISYAILQKYFYLLDPSPIDFYLTPYDNLISHRPQCQSSGYGS